ncbi:hypothetical protein CSE16_13105 [Solibacillus sp. R5-41]|uniref:DUF3139 domain-containing protein n=1 Tax=Solibacillus sp. R5-41 TaxID=2048654 RepID=UPI000C1254C4|nr:DUF3139 domain-containing protein [Solibacillus sp. R5-41]ATP40910.1 hypothetical protein CSE16_13105 [Solibacillus sp. R5-41]
MKKGLMLAFAAIAIIFGIMFSMINVLNSSEPEYDPVIIRSTEEQVKGFLVQEKAYSENEIQKIESKKKAKTSDDSASGYEVEVIFSDEPKAIYYYQVDTDKVEQIGITGSAIKHREIK